MDLLIRPIKPEDAPLIEQLFDTLSFSSIYQRFFHPMKALPQAMLVRFTQIDYDREIAIVGHRSKRFRGADACRRTNHRRRRSPKR